MVYPMMVNLNFKSLMNTSGMGVQVITQSINFLIIPFIAFGLGIIFFKDQPYTALGLLLAALLPTSGMTISWTGFAKGNVPAAVKMTVIGLVLGSLLTPFYAMGLMGTAINIPLLSVFKQIAIIVFLPMILGFFTRGYLIKKHGEKEFMATIKQKFPPMSTAGVLGIVFIAMALKSKSIYNAPEVLFGLFIPLLALYGINFLISTVVGKLFLKRGDAIALVYGTVMRNLSIALAIAMAAFKDKGSEIAIIIALAYIIQVQSAAWYNRFTDKFFGSIEEEDVANTAA